MAENNYEQLAQHILDGIGGMHNVDMLTHCVTRLRFRLRDSSRVDTEKIEALEGVIQVIDTPGQYQVVVGPEVYDVYDAVLRAGNMWTEVSPSELSEDEGITKSVAGFLIDLISSIVAPTLGCLASTGMVKGLLALWDFISVQLFGISITQSGAYTVLYAISDGFWVFLPIMIGFTSAKKFKMNEFIGASLGAMLCYSSITAMAASAWQGDEAVHFLFEGTLFELPYVTDFFGLPIVTPTSANGYTSTLLPVILSCWVSSFIYRWANKKLPATIKLFAVPMLTLVVGGTLTILLLGPISTIISNLVGLFFALLNNIPVVGGAVAGTVLGAVWQVLVIFGFHWALIPVRLTNMNNYFYDFALPGQFGCTWAQIACVLVVILKTKNQELKKTGVASFITGLFGTTEPAIYGVTLPLKTPFVISCIAGAVSGGFYGFMANKSFIMGYSGLLGLTAYIDARTPEQIEALAGTPFYLPNQGITHLLIAGGGAIIAFVLAFVMCWMFWNPKAESLIPETPLDE